MEHIGAAVGSSFVVDDDHMAQAGEISPDLCDLAPVERACGDQHAGVSQLEALADRLRTERGEERARDAAVLQRAEHGGVELGDAPRQHEDPLAPVDTEQVEHVREPRCGVVEGAVGQVDPPAVRARASGPRRRSGGCPRVAVDALVGDVQDSARKGLELGVGLVPAELGPHRCVVAQVGSGAEDIWVLLDDVRACCSIREFVRPGHALSIDAGRLGSQSRRSPQGGAMIVPCQAGRGPRGDAGARASRRRRPSRGRPADRASDGGGGHRGPGRALRRALRGGSVPALLLGLRRARASRPKWFERTKEIGYAVVAVVDDGGPNQRLVGEAGYVLIDNGDAEFGLTVARDWRGWLGPYLLDVLVAVAADHGIPNLEADILAENRPMQTVVRRRGVVTMGDGDDFSVVRVAIAAASHDRPSWPATPGTVGCSSRLRAVDGRTPAMRPRAGFEVMSCGGPMPRCPALEGRALSTCGRRRRHRARADRRADERTRRAARSRTRTCIPEFRHRAAKPLATPATPRARCGPGSTGAEVVATLRRAVGEDS